MYSFSYFMDFQRNYPIAVSCKILYKLPMKLNKTEKKILHIERACGDLRRGMAVFIREENGGGVFAVSPDSANWNLEPGYLETAKLIISRTRALYLFPGQDITSPVAINAAGLSADEILAFCASSPPLPGLSVAYSPASELEQSALKLAKISELLPAVIVYNTPHPNPLPGGEGISGDCLSVSVGSIKSYMENATYSLHEACRTKLTLKGAKDAQIVAYRPNIGAPEHYAIIIGQPEGEPLVRVHSSCYTGDLLASLTCDCRDQLQSAIEIMGKGEGGIILYLMQEGRGIGLVNKLRAYDFKEKGMDTVEANRALGFDDDERLFLPAAEILRKLGINTVRLLTNNPIKATGLEQHGIKVASCVPHIMETNPYNEDYMQTKADKMGHRL